MAAAGERLVPVSEAKGCSGQVVVVLEHYGYEGRAYMQSDVYSLRVECSLTGCYWMDPNYAEQRTTLTQKEIIDLQALHDLATTKEV